MPALISIIAFLVSSLSFGISNSFSFFVSLSRVLLISSNSSLAKSTKSFSFFSSSIMTCVSCRFSFNLLTRFACSATGVISDNSVEKLITSSLDKFPLDRIFSNSIFLLNIFCKLFSIDIGL